MGMPLPWALPIGKGHSENVDKLRFWESNYRPFCISFFILFYCISIFLYIVSISKKLKIKTYQLSISMSNLYLLVINLFNFLGNNCQLCIRVNSQLLTLKTSYILSRYGKLQFYIILLFLKLKKKS
jgi:hypothetical protein